jgi:hypothetical protein
VLRQHPLSPARPRNGLGAGGAGAPHGRRAPALLLCSQRKSSHFTSARIDFQYLDPVYVFATPALGAQASLVQAPLAAFGLRPATTRIFHFIQQESLLPHCCAVVAHVGAGTLLTPP